MIAKLFSYVLLLVTCNQAWAQGDPKIAGTSTGNGGIPLELLFGGVRPAATMLVKKADFLPLDEKKPVDKFILDNYAALSKDIADSPHMWIRNKDEEKDSCAWTAPEPLATITFSPGRCKEEGFVFLGDIEEKERDKLISLLLNQVSGSDAGVNALIERERRLAVMTLIHESVHHVRTLEHRTGNPESIAEEEAFANNVATRIWDLWYPANHQINKGTPIPSLAKGFYVSQAENWELQKNQSYQVKLAPWIEGGFTIESIRSVNGLWALSRDRDARLLMNVKFDHVAGLPENVYLFETRLASSVSPRCEFDYKVKIIAVSELEFYVSEYFPESVYAGNPCVTSGARWNPHIEPYKLIEAPRPKLSRLAEPNAETTLDVYFPAGSELTVNGSKLSLAPTQNSVRIKLGKDAYIKSYPINLRYAFNRRWFDFPMSIELPKAQITRVDFNK